MRAELMETPSSNALQVMAQPLQLPTSGRVAKNRFFKAALSEQMATFTPHSLLTTGIPTQQLIQLYEKFGHGGWGMILTGNVIIDDRHLEAAGNVVVSRETDSAEKQIQFAAMAAAAKSDGALAVVQLGHAGRQTPLTINPQPFSSTEVGCPIVRTAYGKPKSLSREQIQTEVVDRFVYAAEKCVEAGFDGIQVHASHGYLLTQFLSARINNRTDEYGGQVANRGRIVEEIYRAIRAQTPKDFIVGIKMNSADAEMGKLEDVLFLARRFEELGFDFIELSGGSYENWQLIHKRDSTKQREAFFLDCASALKPQLNRMVLYLTGGFRTLAAMSKAVERNEIEGVGLGRPAAAEPNLPTKMLSGQTKSAILNHFDQDFATSMHQAQTQMRQAGSTSWAESENDPGHGITDFSQEKEAENLEHGITLHVLAAMKSEFINGRPFDQPFIYDPNRKYECWVSRIGKYVISSFLRFKGFKA